MRPWPSSRRGATIGPSRRRRPPTSPFWSVQWSASPSRFHLTWCPPFTATAFRVVLVIECTLLARARASGARRGVRSADRSDGPAIIRTPCCCTCGGGGVLLVRSGRAAGLEASVGVPQQPMLIAPAVRRIEVSLRAAHLVSDHGQRCLSSMPAIAAIRMRFARLQGSSRGYRPHPRWVKRQPSTSLRTFEAACGRVLRFSAGKSRCTGASGSRTHGAGPCAHANAAAAATGRHPRSRPIQ